MFAEPPEPGGAGVSSSSMPPKSHYCQRLLELISTDAKHPFILQNNVIFNILARKHEWEGGKKKCTGKLIKSGTFQIIIINLKSNRMERKAKQ